MPIARDQWPVLAALAPRAALLISLVAIGCSGAPRRIHPPAIDAAEAAATALEAYDSNGDGQLQAQEMKACPAFVESLKAYDTNTDGALSAEEIEHGIDRWQAQKMGATSLAFQVKWNGRGLEGAIVKLIPEKFLGEDVKPASGTTRGSGRGYLGIAAEDLPSGAPRVPIVQPGLYRVEITHPSVPIPAKYNSSSTLGVEVAVDRLTPQGLVWALTK